MSAPAARPVIVQKYGGSSVADVAKIGKVADRVVAAKAEGADVVVVVSAMGKTTDQLIALAHSVADVEGAKFEPLMFIPELQATVAELSAEVKNAHSHRGRSAALLRDMLVEAWHLGG